MSIILENQTKFLAMYINNNFFMLITSSDGKRKSKWIY